MKIHKALFLITLFAYGCGAAPNVAGVEGGAAGTTTSTSTSTTVSAIVSQGNNLSFNNRTAGVNDLMVNPVTRLPAIAYHDRDQVAGGSGPTPATGVLKYAYMDANGAWVIEVVDVSYGAVACGTAGSFCIGAPNVAAGTIANIIKLAFKSDGTPAIAYVFGASAAGPGDKEIRYAERSSAGVWTVQRAFTSTIGAASAVTTVATVNPFAGVTLLFDASDRPHITTVMHAATIANSVIKYLFRNSAGAWSNSNIGAAVTAAGTVTLVTNGALQAGAAWCSAGSVATGSPQAPIYLYQRTTFTGGQGHPAYISCTSMSTAGECTAWSMIDLVNSCAGGTAACSSSLTFGADNLVTGTNAGSRVDLAIEPTNNKAVIGIFTTTAINTFATSLQVTVAPNACNVAQPVTAASWNTFSTVDGTANAGANGFRLNVKNSATFYASYLLAAATVRQSRSTNSGIGWFATGHIVETSAVGAEGIGSAYDATGDTLFLSYASADTGGVGAVGHDIKVGYIDPDDLASGGIQGQAHQTETIDNTGMAFPAPIAAALPLHSAAVAPSGLIGFAYYYHDANGIFADSKLYYGIRGGTSASPVFSNRFVTNHQESASALLSIGLSPSLAYDTNSNPVIAYYNGTSLGADQNLTVARSGNGGVSFSQVIVDDASADLGRFPSAVTYGTSIGIAYRDETNTSLKFARWSPVGQWKKSVVDGMAGAGGSGCLVANASGQYSRLARTSTGNPVIVYQDDTGAASLLKIAVAAEAISNSAGTFTWTCLTIDSVGAAGAAGRGEGIDIALDSSDRVHIVHFDMAAGDYRYVTSSTAAGAAVAAGSSAFTASVITNVTTPSLAAGNSIPSIKVNTSGTAYIAFHDVQNRALALASKTSSASSFTLEQVEQAPSLGGITTPFAGQFPVLLLNSSNLPVIFYRSWENWIRYFAKE